MKYRNKSPIPLILIIAAFTLMLAACTAAGRTPATALPVETPESQEPPPLATEENQPKQIDSGSTTDSGTQESTPTSNPPTAAEGNEPAQPEATPLPAGPGESPPVFSPSDRPLAASDPAAFRLDSGQYQLVEFFAFW